MKINIYRLSLFSNIHDKQMSKFFYSISSYLADVDEVRSESMTDNVKFDVVGTMLIDDGPWEIVDALGLAESPMRLGPEIDW